MRLVYVSILPRRWVHSTFSMNVLNPLPFFSFFFCLQSVRYWITGEKSRENVSREKKEKKKKKKKETVLCTFPFFLSRIHIVYRYYRYYRCHNPGIGEILRVREFDGRKRCKKRGKNWRLVASDGTISINRTNRGRNRDPWWRNRGYIYIYIYRLIDGCCPIEITGAYLPG